MTITLSRRTFVSIVVVATALVAAYLLGSLRPSVANAAPTASRPVSATSDPQAGGITVTGTGTVSGTPDTLSVSFSTTATASTIDAALAQATKAQKAVIFSLKSSGVADKDLQTSNFSVQPNYTNKGLPSGYVVTEGVTARIHGLAKAGQTLSSAVAAGGDDVRVDSVWVSIDDTDPLKGDARKAAVADASARAQQYAAAAGRSVGAVQSISEQVSYSPTPYAYDSARTTAGSAASAVPVQAGSQDVSVTVTVVYAFA